jgi:Ca2+/Na+ antiporter
MTTEHTTPSGDLTTGSRTGLIRDPARFRARGLAWLGSALAAVVVWVIALPLAGADLRATVAGTEQEIVLGAVVGSALIQAGVGWAVLALLERFFARARTIWLVLAAVVLVLAGVNAVVAAENTETAVWLNVMHLAVAAVLVPVLARTSPRR